MSRNSLIHSDKIAESVETGCLKIGSPWIAPLAPIYGFVTSTRNRLYDSGLLVNYRAPLPVICVGNAVVGGSGKSPMAAAVASELKLLGRKPTLLLRGYGGTSPGPIEVKGAETAELVGDEALMHRLYLNRDIPVVIARDRVIGAGFIAERELGDTVVLDDGYQHRRLSRNLNLLLIDISSDKAVDDWLEGRLLPAGRLREPPLVALKRADAIILVSRSPQDRQLRGEKIEHSVSMVNGSIPVVGVELFSDRVIESVSGASSALAEFASRPCVAACGLANPQQFFASLERSGIDLRQRLSFRDHHPYSSEDLVEMFRSNLPVLVTAKDAVKLAPFLRPGMELFVVAQTLRWPAPTDRQALIDLLRQASA